MQDHLMHDATPLMRQYFAIRQEYPECLLLFQVGDFYELFFDDAKVAASVLSITLTKRGKSNGEPIPLCGIPVHALDHYLHKLVRAGYKVALCDQLEPAQAGKVVARGVTKVLTPGTLTDARLMDEKSASYLFSFVPLENQWGLVFAELMTAQLYATTIPAGSERTIESELVRFLPDEIVVPATSLGKQFQSKFKQLGYYTSLVDQQQLEDDSAHSWVAQQFPSEIRDQIARNKELEIALCTFYAYVQKNQQQALAHFKSIHLYKPDDFLILDAATQRNLDLVKNSEGNTKHTLLSVIDVASTAMGSRMLKKWLQRPLVKQEAIEQRQEVIDYFLRDVTRMQQLQELFSAISDIERVVGRIALGRAQVQDYCGLRSSLAVIPELKKQFESRGPVLLAMILSMIDDFSPLSDLLHAALHEDSTSTWIIKSGFDQHFDTMRELVEQAHIRIIDLERSEQEKTGISSLKIRYNQVHGYYIEVTKAHYDAIPEYYKRQQTLVGKERFMMPELHELQHEITVAKNQIDVVQKELFDRVKQTVAMHVGQLRRMAHALAHLDALLALATVAYNNGYVRPTLNTHGAIVIKAGRHPVIERSLSQQFIANDTTLNVDESFHIITGPNMGGKSTYLRQIALICVLAHIGSYVPAKDASIALLDRIFTRIGAGDNLADGKSTFLVEMEETAAICTAATERSLVILDEVGRGTSTFDGLAIAQAVIEHLYTRVKSRCLFATHYHELTRLQEKNPGIVCYFAVSKKTQSGIMFLYKMDRGVADGSFGIEVAKLAQLPTSIIDRAECILQEITTSQVQHQSHAVSSSANSYLQINYMKLCDEVAALKQKIAQQHKQLELITEVDLDDLSPKKAFDILWKMNQK